MTQREERLAEVFVELADTLTAEFDLVDLLATLAEVSVELLAVDTARVDAGRPARRPSLHGLLR
ncbi:hypothetical protein [Kribbella qitaiheensis]|uniref:hypothetical protein n=1 Tax=Kribbella qitaiheensis TaxID=1544730 RepID=UPI001FE9BFCF|nr:hypothetical protein [Kribbella qitaiheensis]